MEILAIEASLTTRNYVDRVFDLFAYTQTGYHLGMACIGLGSLVPNYQLTCISSCYKRLICKCKRCMNNTILALEFRIENAVHNLSAMIVPLFYRLYSARIESIAAHG